MDRRKPLEKEAPCGAFSSGALVGTEGDSQLYRRTAGCAARGPADSVRKRHKWCDRSALAATARRSCDGLEFLPYERCLPTGPLSGKTASAISTFFCCVEKETDGKAVAPQKGKWVGADACTSATGAATGRSPLAAATSRHPPLQRVLRAGPSTAGLRFHKTGATDFPDTRFWAPSQRLSGAAQELVLQLCSQRLRIHLRGTET